MVARIRSDPAASAEFVRPAPGGRGLRRSPAQLATASRSCDGMRSRERAFSRGLRSLHPVRTPRVGIPTPMIIDWPDKFYHTSADTPDKVSPNALARQRGRPRRTRTGWRPQLGRRRLARPPDGLALRRGGLERRLLRPARSLRCSKTRLNVRWTDYRRLSAFRTERSDAAVGEPPPAGDRARRPGRGANVGGRGRRDPGRVRPQPPLRRKSLNSGPSAEVTGWRAEAAVLIPRRLAPGPINAGMALQADSPAVCGRPIGSSTMKRTQRSTSATRCCSTGPTAITPSPRSPKLVELETGQPMGEVALRYFKLLAEAKLIEWTVNA